MAKHQRSLVIASIVAVCLWAIPFLRILVLPLMYLNTHLHELCHAATALATGGSPQLIKVFADGSGVTPIEGGAIVPITAAGYIGTATIGGLLVLLGRNAQNARKSLGALGAILFASLVLWVRGDIVGVLTGYAWVGVFALASLKLSHEAVRVAVQFLGVQLCLTSAHAFLALLQLSATSSAPTDAQIQADHTPLPAVVWASIWAILSLLIVVATLRSAWNKAG